MTKTSNFYFTGRLLLPCVLLMIQLLVTAAVEQTHRHICCIKGHKRETERDREREREREEEEESQLSMRIREKEREREGLDL